jgi:hypothetical protein
MMGTQLQYPVSAALPENWAPLWPAPAENHSVPEIDTEEAELGLALCEGNGEPFETCLAEIETGLAGQVSLCEDVFEALRGLWRRDKASNVDITFAMSSLMLAFRRKGAYVPELRKSPRGGEILVLTPDFEPHFAGACIAADWLGHCGHDVSVELGSNKDDMSPLGHKRDIAAIILVTSPVFGRSESATAIAQCVRELKKTSNARPVISLGAIALAPVDEIDRIGFDSFCLSALEIPGLIDRSNRPAPGIDAGRELERAL